MRITNTTKTGLYCSFGKQCRAIVKSMCSKLLTFDAVTNKHFRTLFSRGMLSVSFDEEEKKYLKQLLASNAEEKVEPVEEKVEPVEEKVEPVEEKVEPVEEDSAPTGAAPLVDEAEKSSFSEIQGFMGGLTNPQPKPAVEPDLGSLNTESKEAEKPAAKTPAKKKAAKKKKAGNK